MSREIGGNMPGTEIPLTIALGVTFRRRWRFRFNGSVLPFPFFAEDGTPLWTGRCMIKADYADLVPKLSLSTEDGGVTMDYVGTGTTREVFYGLLITAEQAATLPLPTTKVPKLVYDIMFDRITNPWPISPQKGPVTIDPRATRVV